MELRLRTYESEKATVVEVDGEVELHSAPQLREELHRVCADNGETGRCIIVDLSRVSFIDSTGLGVLIGGLKRARENGSLSLVCPNVRVRRVFEITGLTSVFPMFDSVGDATDDCARQSTVEVGPSEGSDRHDA
ncbi:MAG TPA: STAS domain-containing protein [Abditibacteriaceae bacterium]|jgi:anti-sigma B factor antagonist